MHSFDEDLARRMAGLQRHRLLQGYPMLPLCSARPPIGPIGAVSMDR